MTNLVLLKGVCLEYIYRVGPLEFTVGRSRVYVKTNLSQSLTKTTEGLDDQNLFFHLPHRSFSLQATIAMASVNIYGILYDVFLSTRYIA
jgi:hypothetical protein